MDKSKPRILILYDYFPPAQRSGGITRSLTYLIENFATVFDFYVITSAYDLGSRIPMSGITPDEWGDYKGKARVLYYQDLSFTKFKKEMKALSPEIVYINGIFSLKYNIYPLLLRLFFSSGKFVLVPRGMLQGGALAVKPFKKKIFLTLFKAVGMHKKLIWHATDMQEKNDILRLMSKHVQIILAEDTPDLKKYSVNRIRKINGELKLVFISLLTAKKNLKYFLEKLRFLENNISLDIYGPVKDRAYWQECQRMISEMPANIEVNYRGAIHPDEVIPTLQHYHFLVLPTLGENFGHAIYEALNAGRPVIISDRTPWRQLQEQQAGWDFSLDEENALPNILQECVALEQQAYDQLCAGAQKLARKYVEEAGFEEKYKRLFGLK